MALPKTSKEEVLQIAYQLAAEQGLDSISARKVSAAAGVAVGTIYNYFPSIDDLLLETISYFFEKNIKEKICKPTADETYLEFCKRIYPVLSDALHTFDQNWTAQIHALNAAAEAQGEKREHEILEHGTDQLAKLLEKDIACGRARISPELSCHDIAKYTLESLLASIRSSEDPKVLFCLLENLYSTKEL